MKVGTIVRYLPSHANSDMLGGVGVVLEEGATKTQRGKKWSLVRYEDGGIYIEDDMCIEEVKEENR